MLASIKRQLLRFELTHSIIKTVRNQTRPSFRQAESLIAGKKGVEIGGPSPVFSRSGPFPVYRVLAGLDNVNFSENNFWSDLKGGNHFVYDNDKGPGRQIISDAVSIPQIPDETYDVLLSSHSIEHIANPLKALREWRRIVRSGGHIVAIVPDKRFTYDRNRPITPLAHIVADFNTDVAETDDTHFAEIIALHDLENDGSATTYDAHVARTLDNAHQRIAHHHVFDIELLENLLRTSGFSPVLSDVFRPYHLLVVARKCGPDIQTDPAGARP